MKRITFLLSVILLSFSSVRAQQDHVPGQIMVQLNPGASFDALKKEFPAIKLENHISKDWGMVLLNFDPQIIDESMLLHLMKRSKWINSAQFNHYVTLRADSFPNDTRFPNMWGLHNNGTNGSVEDADIDAVEAWDITPGGITSMGDTIVVAVLDGGFFLTHTDLNYWKNYNEIPNNGIDDDSNGYVDDFDGWNVANNNDNITSDSHGTHVAGTVGARGNNSLGVTGVNANVKVMPLQVESYSESEVVALYNYVYDQRKLYNQTNGAKGAFVVSTNASFGINQGQPSDYPLWCAVYDSLGTVGILSAGATANANWNIDVVGDIPTACASPYMIAVTNTTSSDTRNSGAAYGKTTIDLGAPGTGIWSTYPSNGYNSISGTSMATPHVAGAIGLMYAAACPALMAKYKSRPDSIALVMRELLLNNVDVKTSLQNITSSGGRLNVYKTLMAILNECNAPETPFLTKSCIPDSVNYTFVASPGMRGTHTYWYNSKFDAPVFIGDTFVTPMSQGSFYYVSTFDSVSETFSKKIPAAGKDFIAVLTRADTTIKRNNSAQLYATGGILFSWSPGATLSDSTIANPVATPQDTTTYVVTVTTSDSCIYIDSVIVYVTDTVADTTGVYIHDAGHEKLLMDVYPNPFNTLFTIRFSRALTVSDKASFLVYDMLGKEVKRLEGVTGSTITINKDQMSFGLYFYKFTTGDNRDIVTGKITLVE